MSLWSLGEGNFFYHVPKTGGRAFKYSKEIGCGGHSRVTEQQAKKWAITVIIRDPVDRFLSAYYHTKLCSIEGVHKNIPEVVKVKEYGFRSTPLEMATAILADTNDIDKISFCSPWSHFNTQYWWHQNLNPQNVTYIDYKNLNLSLTPRGETYLGTTSGRVPLGEEPDLQKIVDIGSILYKKDYDYFERLPQIKSITDNWLK